MDACELVASIERRLKELNMKKAEFYSSADISAASFSQWRHGMVFPERAALERINQVLGTNYAVADAAGTEKAAQEGGVVDRYSQIIRSLCGDDQEKLKLLQDALAKNPERTKASFDLFLKTL